MGIRDSEDRRTAHGQVGILPDRARCHRNGIRLWDGIRRIGRLNREGGVGVSRLFAVMLGRS